MCGTRNTWIVRKYGFLPTCICIAIYFWSTALFAVDNTAKPPRAVVAQSIALPTGPGTIQGLGERIEPMLNSGSAVYTVNIDLPQAALGVRPELALRYNSSAGNSPFGVGWSLSIPAIQRQTDKGQPDYRDSDVFLFEGEELVELANGIFRVENESSYQRFRMIEDGWEVTRTDGTRLLFGSSPDSREAFDTNKSSQFNRAFRWWLSETIDVHGNRISYSYVGGDNSTGVRLVSSVKWALRGSSVTPHFRADFEYTSRADAVSDYRSRYRQSIGERCIGIRVVVVAEPDADPAGKLIREYRLDYSPESQVVHAPVGLSLLHKIQQFDGSGNMLPPIRFEYSQEPFSGHKRLSVRSPHLGFPAFESLNADDVAFTDINGDALPDIIFLQKQKYRYSLNLGNDRFTDWVSIQGPTPSFSLASPGCLLLDLDGDGSTELVRCVKYGDTEYYRFITEGQFPKQSVRVGSAKRFKGLTPDSPSDSNVLVLDTDFDKTPDIVRLTRLGLKVCRNRPHPDGGRHWIEDNFVSPQNCGLEIGHVLGGNSDWRIDTADLNGDRLVDLVKLNRLSKSEMFVECWINAGRRFEKLACRLATTNVPHTTEEVYRWADFNCDGLSDLVMISPNVVALWLNRGTAFDDPLIFEAPAYATNDTKLIIQDLNGNGSQDLVWWSPRNLNEKERLRYYDFALVRPNMLRRIDNGIGERITLDYKSSTEFYLAAAAESDPWDTVSPVPVPVLSRMTQSPSLDLDHDGNPDEYVTDFIYRNAFYDGFEKEFRGFTHVTKIEWGDDRPGNATTVRSPTLVSRLRFHTGSPSSSDFHFNEIAGHDEEPLKGKLLWTESCSLHGFRFSSAFDPKSLKNSSLIWIGLKETGAADQQDNNCDGVIDEPGESEFVSDQYVYSRTFTTWSLRTLHSNTAAPALLPSKTVHPKRVVRDAVATRQTTLHIEGPVVSALSRPEHELASTCVVVSEFRHDEFGNEIERLEHGIVSPVVRRDKARTVRQDFARGGAAIQSWILNRVAQNVTLNAAGQVIAATRFRYGDESESFDSHAVGDVGTRALLKQEEALLLDDTADGIPLKALAGAKWIRRRTASHDEYGNTLVSVDALGDPNHTKNGHARTFVFDPAFHAFPIHEQIHIDPNHQLTVHATYDLAFGIPTSITDFNHDAATRLETDCILGTPIGAQRQTFGHLTELQYDSHSRLVAITRPGDSKQFPTQSFSYWASDPFRRLLYEYKPDGTLKGRNPTPAGDWKISLGANNGDLRLGSRSGLSGVLSLQREKSNDVGAIASVTLTDGLERVVAKVIESDTYEKPIVNEAAEFDLRGHIARLNQPFEVMSGISATRSWDHTTQFRDPLGRIIRVVNPPERNEDRGHPEKWSERRSLHLPLAERIYDEEDCRQGGSHEGTPKSIMKDGFGRLVSVTDHVRISDDGHQRDPQSELSAWVTSYEYDVLDNLIKIVDADRNEWVATYDSLKRRRIMDDPDRGLWTFEYDNADNLVVRTDAMNQKLKYTYDGANRRLTETAVYPAMERSPEIISYHYDVPDNRPGRPPFEHANVLGQLSWIEDLSGEEHFSYDARQRITGRLKRIKNPSNGQMRDFVFTTQYDSADREVAATFPNGTVVERTYGARGLLGGISSGKNSIASALTYEPSGKLRSQFQGNVVSSRFEYDPRLRLCRMHVGTATGRVFLDYQYAFDTVSNILNIDDNRPAVDFALSPERYNAQVYDYDNLYRLVHARYPAVKPAEVADWITYRIGVAGIPLEQCSSIPSQNLGLCDFGETLPPNPKPKHPHFLAKSALFDAKSDANGCRTYKAKERAEYDAWHHVKQLVAPIGRQLNLFDFRGERACSINSFQNTSVTLDCPDSRYLSDGAHSRIVCSDGGRHVAYILQGEQCKYEVVFVSTDHLDSPHILTADGELIEQLSYSPFGDTRQEWRQPNSQSLLIHRFNAGVYDSEFDSLLLGPRMLDRQAGGFTSPDPLLFGDHPPWLVDSRQIDPFRFAASNPIHLADPTGRNPVVVAALAVVAYSLYDSPPANAPGPTSQVYPDKGMGRRIAEYAAVYTGGYMAAVGIARVALAIAPTGRYLRTVHDVLKNPRLLQGKGVEEVKAALGRTPGWEHSVMRHSTTHPQGGWVFREMNQAGTNYTGRMIQYHPGTSRHFSGKPYWKVSGAPNPSTVRLPVAGK